MAPDRPPHLALFCRNLRGGGVERVVLTLANEFCHRGMKVDLVLARAEGAFLSQLDPGIEVVDLGTDRLLGYTRRLAGYLSVSGVDTLVSASDECNLAALWAKALARSPVRLLISCHNTVSRYVANSRYLKVKALPALIRLSYPRADAIVAVSEGVAADLAQMAGLSPGRIRVIYNPAVTSKLFELARLRPDHPWFSKPELPVILAVGGLRPAKDFPTLLRAFAKVRSRRPSRLLILGEGRDRPQLEQLVRSLGLSEDVALPGFVDNPYACMARASVFVLSSAWEGFAMVLAEAMALGRPIVSTDCPHGPRELLENGRFGRLVPVGDPEEMAEAIICQLDSTVPLPAVAARGLDFSASLIADQYQALMFAAPPKP